MNPLISTELDQITPRLVRGLGKMGVARDRAEDIVQDALCYLISTKQLESFIPREASLFTFIFKKCLYLLYRETKRHTMITAANHAVSVIQHGLSERNGWEARLVLDQLDPWERELVEDRYTRGYSMAEMSAQRGVNRFTIRRWLKHIEEKLHELL